MDVAPRFGDAIRVANRLYSRSAQDSGAEDRVPQEIEERLLLLPIEQPAFCRARVANELRKRRCVWLRHDLETMKKRRRNGSRRRRPRAPRKARSYNGSLIELPEHRFHRAPGQVFFDAVLERSSVYTERFTDCVDGPIDVCVGMRKADHQ